MPQIIVTADRGDEEAIMLCERVHVTDFESDHFARQLVERLGWAVSDAHEAETAAGGEEGLEEDLDPDRTSDEDPDDASGYPPASVVTTAS